MLQLKCWRRIQPRQCWRQRKRAALLSGSHWRNFSATSRLLLVRRRKQERLCATSCAGPLRSPRARELTADASFNKHTAGQLRLLGKGLTGDARVRWSATSHLLGNVCTTPGCAIARPYPTLSSPPRPKALKIKDVTVPCDEYVPAPSEEDRWLDEL